MLVQPWVGSECNYVRCWLIGRAVVSPAKALIPVIRPLLCATLQDILHILGKVFPHAELGFQRQRRQGSALPVASIGKSTLDWRLTVPLSLLSDMASGHLEDELLLSEEEDVGDAGQTSHPQIKKSPANEVLNFSRLVSRYPIKMCNPMVGGVVVIWWFCFRF